MAIIYELSKNKSGLTRKSNGKLFQLIDPLTLFHLTFLGNGKIDSWMDFVGTPAYYTWCGLAFETVCLLHVKQIKKALEIAGVSSNTFSWKSKHSKPGAQIDLVIDRKDDVINLCEMKYSLEEYVIDTSYEKDLLHKLSCFKEETRTKKALWITMISFAGLYQNEHKNIISCELTGENLFS